MKTEEPVRHEWDPDVLERALKVSTTRFPVLVAVSVVLALAGVVGLATPGTSQVLGLAALMVAAIALSFAIRHKAKRDYCAGQLREIERRKSGTP